MQIEQKILTNNPCYKAGRRITVKGLMLHSVGVSQPKAENFMNNYNKSGAANGTHIGVEMCEPACIRYTAGAKFSCSDRNAALEVVKRTYESAVELFAFLCKEFKLAPLEDGVIISHREGHTRGIASGHEDPEHLWKGLDSGYTMDGFRRDVKEAMGNK